MSKLDRFLISEGLLSVYPSLSALCLDRHLSYHRPIIMHESIVDYGPSLLCVFHSLFAKDGSNKLVDDSWKNSNFMESNKITLLRNKFQALKASIKACPNIKLDTHMFMQISFDQNEDLESEVTYEEIKRAVWDCGTYKSPRRDGFTFDFIRRYRKIINQDVVNVVREFFITSKFPPGSNTSFITLILKKQDPKVVKDFRPISLIGKWDKENIITIVHMLKCFFLASGLKLNIHKSKLIGIGISHEEVNVAANIIGCSTFSTLFNYFGVKVEVSSSRSKSWDEVIAKIFSRLSKWKIKTLSIGINLHSRMKKKVGNGAHTLFWEDSWIIHSALRQIYPRLYALESDKHATVADKLSDVSLIDSFRKALVAVWKKSNTSALLILLLLSSSPTLMMGVVA
nr:RNA-directed DNA polymerase, eukaryota [Tanacetum cinerariifolium]